MCGISVSIALKRPEPSSPISDPATRSALETELSASLDLIAHRGPDAKGIWINHSATIGLGQNRLAINDLSPKGTQPHHSPNNKIHAVVNGEIYDDLQDTLRTRLATEHGYAFQSHADTELVVALYSVYGAPAFLNHLRGEFALVIYDEEKNVVILARDRYGIKPLCSVIVNDGGGGQRLLIASEAKAFLAMGWEPEWDVAAVVEGTMQGHARTMFKGVKKVAPGSWVEISNGGEMCERRYWNLEYRDKREVETRSVEEMILGVREKLTEAVKVRLRADVPVGIYLSGGIDSSLLAGIVTHLVREEGIRIGNQDATNRICCFSIEFPDGSGFNESDIAERTADWLGVQILKKHMDEETLAENFADSAYHSEQHNVDLNSVGKFILSTLPQENGYKVVLTGEGADEHFAGYPFFLPDSLMEADLSMPDSELAKSAELRQSFKKEFQLYFTTRSKAGGFLHPMDQSVFGPVNNVRALGWTQAWYPSLHIFAPWVREKWAGNDCRLNVINETLPDALEKIQNKWHPLHASQYLETTTLLPYNLLTCLGDRSEMAHSVEARPPFLDHVFSEYVNNLPPSLKLAYTPDATEAPRTGGLPWGDGRSVSQLFTEKWILREAGKPYLTEELYHRKKQPYLAPNRCASDGPLHKKLKEICTKEAIEKLGFVDWDLVEQALDKAVGEDADPLSFRVLLVVASWVVIGERFGVKPAKVNGEVETENGF
ncbi:hypothetical protein N0V88_007588 [Collariella sp. IMI 366227]|nr:hypothetical protein N0V88_007588 [Collariella sp. IMI 366227]